jgi:hypothetical protein
MCICVGCFVAHFRPGLVFFTPSDARCALISYLQRREAGVQGDAQKALFLWCGDVRNSQNRCSVEGRGAGD